MQAQDVDVEAEVEGVFETRAERGGGQRLAPVHGFAGKGGVDDMVVEEGGVGRDQVMIASPFIELCGHVDSMTAMYMKQVYGVNALSGTVPDWCRED